MSKILILTSTVPGSGGVGDIYIKNIISELDASNFVRVSLIKGSESELPSYWEGIESKVINITKSHYPILSSYYFNKFVKNDLKDISKNLVEYINEQGIDKIWVTLSSPEIIALIREVVRVRRIKVYSTIWDVPEYLLQNNHFDPILKRKIKTVFNEVLDSSEKISVIDEGMRKYLAPRLQKKSIIIRNGVTFPENSSQDEKVKDRNVIKIAFAGSIYAKREWNAFIRSLISCDFTINNKRVEVICIGRLPRFGIVKDQRIEFLPFMPNDDVLQILSQCDIGYVPYWFSNRKRLIVTTSFPGKVSSYISVGLKILFHGPKNSSVNDFLLDTSVGISCLSSEKFNIMDSITKVDGLKVSNESLNYAKETLSIKKMQENFKVFIK
ncbi:hypothetical protein LG195_04295 [Proteus terrae]|uniref:hypothetical protein n=1 Tax=Proteus terrae TaxID=1574161 RepID=UPI00207C58EF|nr:hypothetical protein [Proteus terrae]MCO4182529.1 hypothetical protein [Proteus terrae]MCO4188271.1 hypothetical protein [Proteus terrae]